MRQTTRTLVTMLVLVLLGGGIGLYAYFGVHEKDRKADEKKEHDDHLFTPYTLGEKLKDGGIPPVEFTALSLTANGQTTSLTRRPGEPWRIVTPVQAPADKLVLDSVVSQLQQAKFKSTVDEKPDAAALAKYGLDKPSFELEAQAEVGEGHQKRSVKLKGGIENTYDGTVFMQKDDQPTVYAGEGGARYAFAKSTFDLRDKEVFAYAAPDLTKIEVKAENNHFSLEKTDAGWQLVDPLHEAADNNTVVSLVASLKSDHATAFPPDEPGLRAARGLEPPQTFAHFELADGGAVTFKAGKAKPDAGDTNVYALIDGAGGPVFATLAKAPELDRNPADLRDRTVLQLKKDQVAKIVFHPGAALDGGIRADIVVERAARADGGMEEAWNVTAPRTGKAQTFKISALMWSLGGLKWTKAGEEKPKDWSKYGIDAKSRSVTFFGADGKELTRLVFGKDVPNSPDSYVRGSRDQVVEANLERLRDLPGDPIEVIEAPQK